MTMQQPRPAIRQLPPAAALGLAGGYSVHSFAHAVEQLCANSIDAGAGAVSVAFDAARLTATVSDDGAGIPAASFPLLGARHCSSKGVDLASALGGGAGGSLGGGGAGGSSGGGSVLGGGHGGGGGGGQTLGFRGAFLASLAEVAQVEIVSKAASAFETHRKVLGGGRAPRCGLALRPRAARGTEVMLTDFLGRQPVRLKALTQQRFEYAQPCFHSLLHWLWSCCIVELICDRGFGVATQPGGMHLSR